MQKLHRFAVASQTFTSWKLDLLNAAGMDTALKPVSVRLLLRLVEALDEGTWDRSAHTCAARIGDDVIADESPGLKDRQSIRDHRKALAAAGWLSFEPGSGRRATVYLLTDKPANAILDRRIELRAARKERREAERLARMVKAREGGKGPLISVSRGGQRSPHEGDVYPPVHLTGSPYLSSLPAQDVALGHDPETGEIPSPADGGGGQADRDVPICEECDSPARVRCAATGRPYCGDHQWFARRPSRIGSSDYWAASRGE